MAREFDAKILYTKQTERLQERLSHVICELYFGVVCGLIDNTLHGGRIYNYYMKSYAFFRPDKLFFRVHSLIQDLYIGY